MSNEINPSTTKAVVTPGTVNSGSAMPKSRHPLAWFGLVVLVIIAGFSKSLIDLVRFTSDTDLFSYILLIPFISGYLIWQKRPELAATSPKRSPMAAIPGLIGALLLAVLWFGRARGWQPTSQDSLCLIVLSFYLLLLASGFFFLGREMMKAIAFPAAFLVFIVPLPEVAVEGLEVFFQYTSADATNIFLALTGQTYVRDGLDFKLPGITITVGQVCSGVRSSLVLFIVSLVAGHLFLRSYWHRALFSALVIPLGILRNAFRIWTITMLSVHVTPSMIDSPIHHRGGPIFFALSLVPFLLVLLYLRRREKAGRSGSSGQPPTH